MIVFIILAAEKCQLCEHMILNGCGLWRSLDYSAPIVRIGDGRESKVEVV